MFIIRLAAEALAITDEEMSSNSQSIDSKLGSSEMDCSVDMDAASSPQSGQDSMSQKRTPNEQDDTGTGEESDEIGTTNSQESAKEQRKPVELNEKCNGESILFSILSGRENIGTACLRSELFALVTEHPAMMRTLEPIDSSLLRRKPLQSLRQSRITKTSPKLNCEPDPYARYNKAKSNVSLRNILRLQRTTNQKKLLKVIPLEKSNRVHSANLISKRDTSSRQHQRTAHSLRPNSPASSSQQRQLDGEQPLDLSSHKNTSNNLKQRLRINGQQNLSHQPHRERHSTHRPQRKLYERTNPHWPKSATSIQRAPIPHHGNRSTDQARYHHYQRQQQQQQHPCRNNDSKNFHSEAPMTKPNNPMMTSPLALATALSAVGILQAQQRPNGSMDTPTTSTHGSLGTNYPPSSIDIFRCLMNQMIHPNHDKMYATRTSKTSHTLDNTKDPSLLNRPSNHVFPPPSMVNCSPSRCKDSSYSSNQARSTCRYPAYSSYSGPTTNPTSSSSSDSHFPLSSTQTIPSNSETPPPSDSSTEMPFKLSSRILAAFLSRLGHAPVQVPSLQQTIRSVGTRVLSNTKFLPQKPANIFMNHTRSIVHSWIRHLVKVIKHPEDALVLCTNQLQAKLRSPGRNSAVIQSFLRQLCSTVFRFMQFSPNSRLQSLLHHWPQLLIVSVDEKDPLQLINPLRNMLRHGKHNERESPVNGWNASHCGGALIQETAKDLEVLRDSIDKLQLDHPASLMMLTHILIQDGSADCFKTINLPLAEYLCNRYSEAKAETTVSRLQATIHVAFRTLHNLQKDTLGELFSELLHEPIETILEKYMQE